MVRSLTLGIVLVLVVAFIYSYGWHDLRHKEQKSWEHVLVGPTYTMKIEIRKFYFFGEKKELQFVIVRQK